MNMKQHHFQSDESCHFSSSLQGKHHLGSPRSYFTLSGVEAKKAPVLYS